MKTDTLELHKIASLKAKLAQILVYFKQPVKRFS